MAPKIPKPADPAMYRLNVVSFSVVRDGGADARWPDPISEPAAVARIARALIPDDAKEHCWVLLLNTRNGIVAAHEVSVGTLSASLVAPREVFAPALRVMGVAAVIVVHNHPSGDPTPSAEDIRLTRSLAEAGRLLEIKVHDHVIIGSGGDRYVSLAERGLL
jgi:DNA repair protein RadC